MIARSFIIHEHQGTDLAEHQHLLLKHPPRVPRTHSQAHTHTPLTQEHWGTLHNHRAKM